MPTCGFNGDGQFCVYKYLDYKPKPLGVIELDMPMLGKKIIVDVGKKPS